MPKQSRINVRTLVNASAIRREKRDGRDVIIVPSATLPDNVVMNRIRYPAEEIEKSYQTLDGTPAPLGHPELNGKFVSASDPRGMVAGFVGAWNENVRRENGRVFIDKIIDVGYASQLEGGRAVLNAIEKGEPIHTSTGLLARMRPVKNDDSADAEAFDMVFDHDAILLDVAGAATPEQGVGMLVNKAIGSDGEEIEVINSALDEAMRELDWAVDYAARAAEKLDRLPLLERIKTAILEALRGTERETSNNEQENDMSVSKEQFDALSQEVKTLSESMKGIGDTIGTAVANAVTASMKAFDDARVAAANAAKDDAELGELRTKIINAGLMDEAAAGELTLNAARALAPKATPGKAAALNTNQKQAPAAGGGYKLPKAEG